MAEQEKEQQIQAAEAAETAEERTLLDKIIDDGRLARDVTQREYARDLIGEFVKQVMDGAIVVSKDTEMMINSRIAQLDRLISAQLNEIMHHQDFQKLEASWRGLSYLVDQTETGEKLRIRVMNITKQELLKDMEKAAEFDQSTLFKKIYEEEFGTFGGASYGCLIGDYEFATPPGSFLLEKMSQVASSAHAPFISAASPAIFNLESFTDLGNPATCEDLPERGVRQVEVLPRLRGFPLRGPLLAHTLMRLPYGQATVPVETFDFEENVDGSDHGKYLWGNAAYAHRHARNRRVFQVRMDGRHQGGRRGRPGAGAPVHSFRTDEGEVALKCPTENAITDRREKELADLGFIPWSTARGPTFAAFFSTQTCNKPRCTTATRPTPMRGCPRSSSTSLRFPVRPLPEIHHEGQDRSFMTRKNVRTT
jgi:type VI secretion system protein ImpC